MKKEITKKDKALLSILMASVLVGGFSSLSADYANTIKTNKLVSESIIKVSELKNAKTVESAKYSKGTLDVAYGQYVSKGSKCFKFLAIDRTIDNKASVFDSCSQREIQYFI